MWQNDAGPVPDLVCKRTRCFCFLLLRLFALGMDGHSLSPAAMLWGSLSHMKRTWAGLPADSPTEHKCWERYWVVRIRTQALVDWEGKFWNRQVFSNPIKLHLLQSCDYGWSDAIWLLRLSHKRPQSPVLWWSTHSRNPATMLQGSSSSLWRGPHGKLPSLAVQNPGWVPNQQRAPPC